MRGGERMCMGDGEKENETGQQDGEGRGGGRRMHCWFVCTARTRMRRKHRGGRCAAPEAAPGDDMRSWREKKGYTDW